MANLPTKKLSFRETFRGFHLRIEFDCVPVSNDPRNIHDYNIMPPTIHTVHENIDVQLLMQAYDRILFDIEQSILNKTHSLYMDALKAEKSFQSHNKNQFA